MSSLALAGTHSRRSRPGRWLAAAALAVTAIAIRRVGVALVPPLVYVAWTEWRADTTGRRIAWASSALLLAVAATWAVARTSTLSDASYIYRQEGAARLFGEIPFFRVKELGELLLNVPAAKLSFVPLAWFFAAGVIAATLVIGGAYIVVTTRGVDAIDIYFVVCAAILSIWPTDDARFFMPVLPVLAAYAIVAMRRLMPRLVTACACAFFCAGIAALAYSTWLTFSDARFPDRYGDATLRPSYCAAFASCVPNGPVDTRAVSFIRELR